MELTFHFARATVEARNARRSACSMIWPGRSPLSPGGRGASGQLLPAPWPAPAPPALPEGGRIINIGSGVAARTGAAGVADHAGTKAALAGFTRGAARDLAPRGITVNLLQAGLVATQLNTGEGSAAPRLIASVALGRMGRPEEIAAGVLFLASPGASYVTGATLDIDGGYGA